MKIKFISTTCEKYHNDRVEGILNTWAVDQNITFLSDVNVSDKIIGYDYLPKGYENIHYKYLEFLLKFDFQDEDWFFFTDDDTFVNVGNIHNLLQSYDFNDPICLGHLGVLNPNATDDSGQFTGFPLHTIMGKDTHLPIKYPSGGAGFILSKNALNLVREYLFSIQRFEIPRSYNSDVTMGFWLRNSKINLIDIQGFWWINPTQLNHNIQDIKNSYTYHYVTPDMMREIKNNL
jgi:hypothetical protein